MRWRRWQSSPVTGESAKETVKTTAQGRPGTSGEPVVTYSCAFYFAREAAGALARPAFPAPFIRRVFVQTLGRHRVARSRSAVLGSLTIK